MEIEYDESGGWQQTKTKQTGDDEVNLIKFNPPIVYFFSKLK